MPFIEKQVKIKPVELKSKVAPDTKDLVEEYTKFVESAYGSSQERDWVIERLLVKAINRDPDFKAYKAKKALEEPKDKKPLKAQAVA